MHQVQNSFPIPLMSEVTKTLWWTVIFYSGLNFIRTLNIGSLRQLLKAWKWQMMIPWRLQFGPALSTGPSPWWRERTRGRTWTRSPCRQGWYTSTWARQRRLAKEPWSLRAQIAERSNQRQTFSRQASTLECSASAECRALLRESTLPIVGSQQSGATSFTRQVSKLQFTFSYPLFVFSIELKK